MLRTLRTSVSALRDVLPLLRPMWKGAPCCLVEQKRTTVVVERMHPIQLAKIGRMPRLRKRHRLLRLVENENLRPATKMKCILTQDVEGVGVRDSVVWVERNLFRNQLYPAQMAIYASPENLEEIGLKEEDIEEGPSKAAFSTMTGRQLQVMHMRVPVNGDTSFVLDKTHIKVALRKSGVELDESCITMPEKPITEPQEITIGITINGQETVEVKGTVFNRYKETDADVNRPELPPLWSPRPTDT